MGITPDLTQPRRPESPENAALLDYILRQQNFIDRLFDLLVTAINDRHMIGAVGNRPAAGEEGRTYFSNDENPRRMYFDDGIDWYYADLTKVSTADKWFPAMVTLLGSYKLEDSRTMLHSRYLQFNAGSLYVSSKVEEALVG